MKLVLLSGAKTIESASSHCGPVTCLALSSDGSYLVTGSGDSTVIIWRILKKSHGLTNASDPPSPLAAPPPSPRAPLDSGLRRRLEGPLHVLRGHLGEVKSCHVSSECGLVASCSDSSGVLLHCLRRGRLVRKLDITQAHTVSLSSQGVLLVWNSVEQTVSTFTVNGLPIATSSLAPLQGKISCISISADGENALLGTSSLLSSNSPDFPTTESIPVPSVIFINLHSLRVHPKFH